MSIMETKKAFWIIGFEETIANHEFFTDGSEDVSYDHTSSNHRRYTTKARAKRGAAKLLKRRQDSVVIIYKAVEALEVKVNMDDFDIVSLSVK